MRQIFRQPYAVIAAVVGFAAIAAEPVPALSQGIGSNGNPYFYSNQTYTYGMHLPQVPIQNGQDEVRSADGTTCRSSMGSNSAYLDVGAIGSQGYGGEFDQGTFYGRLIIPLGEKPRRVDCTRLYELEIQRLRHELQLVRAGVGSMTPLNASADAANGVPASPESVAARPAHQPVDPKQEAALMRSEKAMRNSAQKGKGWATSGWSATGWQGQSRLGGDVLNAPTSAPAMPSAIVHHRAVGRPASGVEYALVQTSARTRTLAPDAAPLPARKRQMSAPRVSSSAETSQASTKLRAFAPAWLGAVDIAKASSAPAVEAGWQPTLVVGGNRLH